MSWSLNEFRGLIAEIHACIDTSEVVWLQSTISEAPGFSCSAKPVPLTLDSVSGSTSTIYSSVIARAGMLRMRKSIARSSPMQICFLARFTLPERSTQKDSQKSQSACSMGYSGYTNLSGDPTVHFSTMSTVSSSPPAPPPSPPLRFPSDGRVGIASADTVSWAGTRPPLSYHEGVSAEFLLEAAKATLHPKPHAERIGPTKKKTQTTHLTNQCLVQT